MTRLAISLYSFCAILALGLIVRAGLDMRGINVIQSLELAVQGGLLGDEVSGYSYRIVNAAPAAEVSLYRIRLKVRLGTINGILNQEAIPIASAPELRAKLASVQENLNVLERKLGTPEQEMQAKQVRVALASFIGATHDAVEELIAMQTSALRLYVSWVLVLAAMVALAGLVFLIQRGKMDRLNRELRRMASEDALTGLPNRRTAYRQAEILTNLAARSGRSLSIAVLDIDHFKSVNDDFGHPAGDGVLRTVAAKLKAELRGCDVAARMGGEEFILILPDSDEPAAQAACERIRLAIAEAETLSESHAIRVTVSVGIATGKGPACGFETLYQRADKALYAAKAAGRDRVVASAWPLLATG